MDAARLSSRNLGERHGPPPDAAVAHSVGAASGARVPWVAVGGSCLSRCRCAARLLKTRWPWPGLSETRWRWGAGLEADVYCSWLSAGPLGSGERELEPRLRRGSFLSLLTCASLSRSRFQVHRSSRSKTTAPPLRPPGALCCLHSSPFASPSAHPHAAMHAVGAFHPCVCARACACARAWGPALPGVACSACRPPALAPAASDFTQWLLTCFLEPGLS